MAMPKYSTEGAHRYLVSTFRPDDILAEKCDHLAEIIKSAAKALNEANVGMNVETRASSDTGRVHLRLVSCGPGVATVDVSRDGSIRFGWQPFSAATGVTIEQRDQIDEFREGIFRPTWSEEERRFEGDPVVGLVRRIANFHQAFRVD